jgi:hypothetical protein
MDFRNNRNTILLAFILLMLAGVALLESSALVVLILLGLLFLVRQFDNNQLDTGYDYDSNYDTDYDYYEDSTYGYEYDYDEESRINRQAHTDPVYRHALESVERAGLNPDDVKVLVVDIGVMTFKEDGEPTVFRTWSLPDDVDYVQPFVWLRLPSQATGLVRFELLDATGDVIYVHEDDHNLQRGRNFVVPKTRLPIHEALELDGTWGLRVSADGVILAEHQFNFLEPSDAAIRRHIGEDGEINTELRAVMQENRLPKMSLDDLLAYQEQEDEQQQRGG